MTSKAIAATAIAGLLVSSADGVAAEKFQKLGGSQIRAKFVGMEMTDMCIGPMCLVRMATSRAIRWAARRTANGESKGMNCVSIAGVMTEAATKCGCPERMSN